MRPVIRPLLVLHPDASLRARVREACGTEFEYVEVEDWTGLEAAVRASPPSAVVLLDPTLPDDPHADLSSAGSFGLSSRASSLLQAYPSTAVVAALHVPPEAHELVRKLGRWGVVQVITLGHDDTVPAISRRLRAARSRPLRSLLEEVLPPETSGRARAIFDAAVEVVTSGGVGRDLAAAMGLSPRTLVRWTRLAGTPPGRLLLAWMRLLLACALLDDPGRSVRDVAAATGYASDSGLRRVTQKLLGASPTDLRDRRAFRTAAAAFVGVLNEYRLRVRVTTREG